MIPYRDDAHDLVAALPAPPLWQRLAAILPCVGRRWQWFRARERGRWCFLFTRKEATHPWNALGWRRVPACPAKDTVGSTFRRGECTEEQCRCEVWP